MSILARSPADRVIVVGAGVAGLSLALRLSPRPVTLITAAPLGLGTATGWAQGGIAAAIGADDQPALHAADTEAAGAGLTEADVADRVTTAAPSLIDWLLAQSIAFDRENDGALALGLEAAHRRRRIVRARGDSTGRAVLDGLVRAVAATTSVEVLVATVRGLMQNANGAIHGVVCERDGAAFRLPARAVVLATGGIGALYASTTNPRGATGRGLLLAARAGAVLRDLEFVQFHPTAIAVGADPMPLATEALRGEGARLVDEQGRPVMAGIGGGDLAPRDVVARAIFQAQDRGASVFLDARGELGRRMPGRFPTVAGLCAEAGIDPALQVIPVRPAAHYHMGGALVDGQGRTTVPGLWACGEVASTGLHGANRLASNSLLEALAFSTWIADAIDTADWRFAALPNFSDRITGPLSHAGEEQDEGRDISGDGASLTPTLSRTGEGARCGCGDDRGAVRAIMERSVGVVRDAEGLTDAVRTLSGLARAGSDGALTGLMIAVSALARCESRGAHWRADHPGQSVPGHTLTTLGEVLRQASEIAATRQRESSDA